MKEPAKKLMTLSRITYDAGHGTFPKALEDHLSCSDLHSEITDTLLVEGDLYNNCERIVECVISVGLFIAVRLRRVI
jgi:hypothetical protein